MNEHPVLNAFPPMSADAYATFLADIRAHGIREPVVVWRGQLIDGRHRKRAADELGIACPTFTYEGEDPVAYAVSANMHRRQMSKAQCAVAAAFVANLPRGRPENASNEAITQSDAARMFNVSRSSVQDAAAVRAHAPELVAAVQRDEVPLREAARTARARQAATPRTRAPATPEPARRGWMELVHAYTNGEIRNTVLRDNKAAIEAELGEAFDGLLVPGSALAQRVIAAAKRWFDRTRAPTREAIAAERAALPATRQREFDRLVERESARIRAELQAQVTAAVAQQVAAATERAAREEARYHALYLEVQAEGERQFQAAGNITTFLTRDEFRALQSVCHPDRPDRTPEALHRAAAILNRIGDVLWTRARPNGNGATARV